MDPPPEDAWIESYLRLFPRWQSRKESFRSPIPVLISRVNQFDAARLDVEMSAMLKEQLVKVFSLMKPGILFQYEAELDTFLEFLIWRFSIWVDKPTPGNALMNLRYRDERAPTLGRGVRTGLEGPGLTASQKIWYCLSNVGGQYLWARLQSFSAYRRWGDSEQRSLGRGTWILIQRMEGLYKFAAFANLLIFLYSGRYRTIIERVLGARLVYGSPHMNRSVSFEYMNRQLVWNEFSEMLLVLLPLLNSSSVKRLLLPFSKDKSSGFSSDDSTCPICQATPTIPFVALPCQHRSHYQPSYDFRGYTESSHVREPRNGKVTLPLIDSLENCDPRNRRMETQNADLFEEGNALGHGLSCNYPLVRSYLVSPLMPYETLYSSEAYDHNFMDRPHQNALPRRKPNNMVIEKHSSGINSALHMQKRDIIAAKRIRDHLHANDKSSLGAANEYNARNPSFDPYKNDQFSAMNLLRLMDQAVCSTQPTCSSMDIIPRGFSKHYDFSYTNRQKEFSEKTSLRTNHPFMNLTAKESLARSYSEIPSNLSHHVPISGDPGTSFPWNSPYSGNYSPNPRNKDMYCGEAQLFPAVARGKEKQSISHLASQMREGESYKNFVHGYQNLQDNHLPLMNYDSSRAEFSPSDEAMEVQKRTDAAGVCVLNRNPADFTVANDSNEYMRHLDDSRLKNASLQENRLPLIYPYIQRQKKAMKLTALKGLLRN